MKESSTERKKAEEFQKKKEKKSKLLADNKKIKKEVEGISPARHPFLYLQKKHEIKKIENELASLNKVTTAQKTIAYEMMYEDGICKVKGNFYTKMLTFNDINYDLLEEEDRAGILEDYSSFINFFDPSVYFNMLLFNRKINEKSLMDQFSIPPQGDFADDLREELEKILKTQAAKGTNGIIKSKYFIFGCECENLEDARLKIRNLEADICRNFINMGTFAKPLNGNERLQVMYEYFNQGQMCPIRFDLKELMVTGSSEKDLIAPSCFDFSWDESFKMGNMYGGVSYINIIAPKATDQFLKKILDIDDNITVSIHMNTFDPLEAIKMVDRKLADIQANKIDEQKKAVRAGYDMDILPAKLLAYEADTKALSEDLNNSNQKLVTTTYLVAYFAKSQKKLATLRQRIDGIVQQSNNLLVPLSYIQEQALMSASPIGRNTTGEIPFLKKKSSGVGRVLTTRCCAVMVPFCTQELFMPAPALYYGLNTLSNNIILADRKALRNPNGVVLGTPGSGKSFAVKRELLSVFLMDRDDIIICDPEGEYYPLVNALHGQVIKLATTSKDYLNPMDIILSGKKDEESVQNDKEALQVKSDFILTLCDNIAGGTEGLGNDVKGIIDECIKDIYEKYINDPIPENMPVLEDLYNALNTYDPKTIFEEGLKIEAKKQAVRIASSLNLFVHGSQNYFNHRTTVDSRNRVICFDIRDLSTQLKSLGMLIVQDAVWNRVSNNRGNISTRYYCDEFHLMLRDKQTSSYMVEMWKRFRKWGGIPTGITQNVTDFFRSPDVEGILGNSDFVYLLNQSADDQDILADKLHLSEEQLKFVTDSDQGCGLIKYNNVILPFTDRYPIDTNTYKVMTTKPQEAM